MNRCKDDIDSDPESIPWKITTGLNGITEEINVNMKKHLKSSENFIIKISYSKLNIVRVYFAGNHCCELSLCLILNSVQMSK